MMSKVKKFAIAAVFLGGFVFQSHAVFDVEDIKKMPVYEKISGYIDELNMTDAELEEALQNAFFYFASVTCKEASAEKCLGLDTKGPNTANDKESEPERRLASLEGECPEIIPTARSREEALGMMEVCDFSDFDSRGGSTYQDAVNGGVATFGNSVRSFGGDL
eukprot:TRINITY_DN19491_c0_g1_i1.p1 TRINITY_DN19491_c0_g1~~TRINITY_DN19491_c0_g1_i1.p1  ORF type:complete len:180 (-),score=43.43 TRINITY_DN19491_c0_g1_i1:792-1280(-)